jgi:hypothetical protein
MRAAVFYEPEYRELCLQQLSSFNPDRMSIGKWLTELCRSSDTDFTFSRIKTSVPEVFGPPGSVSQRYGSGSSHHQAKIVRKPLISTVL